MSKKFLSTALLASLFAGSAFSAEELVTGVVNFASCVTDSEQGKKEQENFASLRKQLTSMIAKTEEELKEVSSKLEDTDYLDGLAPSAEAELQKKYQALQEDLGRAQGQFYQMLEHANYQMIQRMSNEISSAAKQVAEDKGLACVIRQEACFYSSPKLDVTTDVISKMNANYKDEAQTSDNQNAE